MRAGVGAGCKMEEVGLPMRSTQHCVASHQSGWVGEPTRRASTHVAGGRRHSSRGQRGFDACWGGCRLQDGRSGPANEIHPAQCGIASVELGGGASRASTHVAGGRQHSSSAQCACCACWGGCRLQDGRSGPANEIHPTLCGIASVGLGGGAGRASTQVAGGRQHSNSSQRGFDACWGGCRLQDGRSGAANHIHPTLCGIASVELGGGAGRASTHVAGGRQHSSRG